MSALRVRTVWPADLRWQFRGGESLPRVYTGYASAELDPMPGYAHDVALVRSELERIADLWPPGTPVTIWVSAWEETSRTNAYTGMQTRHEDLGDEKYAYRPEHAHIFMSGKRTPPLPTTTRYLVAHEYGHAVEVWISDAEGYPARGRGDGRTDFLRDYARARGMSARQLHGEPGRWHRAVAEVFACDFRVLIAESETEAWPHPGITRPEEVPGLAAWWRDHSPKGG